MMCTVACLRKAKTVQDTALAERLKELAFFMIDRTLPYKTLEDPYVLKGNPRFCTQYNNSQTGEGIGPILSGTASWLTLALYEVLGLNFDGDYLDPDPVMNARACSYSLRVGDTVLEVRIDGSRSFRRDEKTRMTFDGIERSGKIELPADGRTHRLEILL